MTLKNKRKFNPEKKGGMEKTRSNNRKILEDGRKKNRNEEVGTMRKINLEEDEEEDEKTCKEVAEEEEKNPKAGKKKKHDPPDNPGTLVTPEREESASSRKDEKNDKVGNSLDEKE